MGPPRCVRACPARSEALNARARVPGRMAGLPLPPAFKLEDAGVTWSRHPEGFAIERVPTARYAMRGALFAAVFGGFGVFQVVQGSLGAGLAFIALGSLGIVMMASTARVRARVVLRGDGSAAWERSGPGRAPPHGRWAAGTVRAARLWVGRQPVRFGAKRHIRAEVQVGEGWETLAWGQGRRERAEDIVAQLCACTGLPRAETYVEPQA
jgi:hypothetical protein